VFPFLNCIGPAQAGYSRSLSNPLSLFREVHNLSKIRCKIAVFKTTGAFVRVECSRFPTNKPTILGLGSQHNPLLYLLNSRTLRGIHLAPGGQFLVPPCDILLWAQVFVVVHTFGLRGSTPRLKILSSCDPQVSVYVKEYTNDGISVAGEVMKPGVYSALGPHRLFDILQISGGLTEKASGAVTVSHRGDEKDPIQVVTCPPKS
jgi:hypothetical protein